MRFGRLVIENYLSIRKFSIDLSNLGPVLITGPNGSGKSGLLSSPFWVMYGESSRKIKAAEVVNERVGKNCYGSLIVFKSDKTYRFQRTRKHSKFGGDSFSVSEVKRSKKGKKKRMLIWEGLKGSEKFVKDLLGLDYVGAVNSIYMPQKTDFLSVLTNSERMAIFETFLLQGLKLNHMADVFSRWTSDKGIKIEKLESKQETLEELLEEYDQEIQTSAAKKSLKAKKEKIEEKIVEYEISLAELDEKEAELRTQVSELNAKKTECVKNISKIESELKEAKKRQKNIEELIKDGKCSKCGQPISGEYKGKEVKELYKKARSLSSELKLWEGDSTRLELDLDQLKRNIAKVLKDRQSTIDQKGVQEGRLSVVNSQSSELSKLKERRKNTLEKLEGISEKIDTVSFQMRCTKFLRNLYSKILKQVIVQDSLPYFSERCNYYLRKFSEIRIKLYMKNGKFEMDFVNPRGGSSYEKSSGGQQRVVDIAMVLACMDLLSRSASSTVPEMLFMDEPVENLDPVNIEKVVELILGLQDDKKTILIASHAELKGSFPTVLEASQDHLGFTEFSFVQKFLESLTG